MSKKKNRKYSGGNFKNRMVKDKAPAKKIEPTKAFDTRVNDGFLNVGARTGLPANNLISASGYAFNNLTDNREQLEAMHRTSWLVRAVIDEFAKDMTSEGVTLISDIEPDQEREMQAELISLGIWKSLKQLLEWARLYGGAISVIEIEGQDKSTPLLFDRIGKDQFLGLTTYDRWYVQPQTQNVTPIGANKDEPIYYTLLPDLTTNPNDSRNILVHHSRVIRAVGNELTKMQKNTTQLWGQSIIESFYDRLLAFDNATMSVANLVQKSYLTTVSIEGLRTIISAGGDSEKHLMKMFDELAFLQNNSGITLVDTQDKVERSSYTFAGLDTILLQFAQQLTGAFKMPLVRIMHETPSGLNTNIENIYRQYYGLIGTEQNNVLGIGMMKVLKVMHMSMFGKPVPKGFNFEFNSLWHDTRKDKVEMSASITTQVTQLTGAGIYSQSMALAELKKQSEYTGVHTVITDEDIEEAKGLEAPLIDLNPPPQSKDEEKKDDDKDEEVKGTKANSNG